MLGSFLNAKKKIACFYIWSMSEILWMILDLSKGVYGRAFLDFTSLVFAIYGIYEWGKSNEKIKFK